MKKDLLPIALEYHRSGLHVLPVNDNKRPLYEWKAYQKVQTENDVLRDFSVPHWGIAVVTGIGGLEVVDVDAKHDPTGKVMPDFFKIADDLTDNKPALSSLTVQETKSGGAHVMYRCPSPGNNTKLARRPPNETEDPHEIPVLIETRGTGGYVVVHPSPGYYVTFGSLTNIPTISQTTRDTILTAARSFDEIPAPAYEKPPREAYTPPPGNSITPWDDYNDRVSAIDVLQQYGWTVVYQHGEKVFLKRPGKTDNPTSGNYHEGLKVFVAHTSSTCLPAEQGLKAWSIYKYYAHNGDAVAAGRQLYADGYGTRYEKKEPVPAPAPLTPEKAKEQEDELMKKVWATKFDYNAPITEADAILGRWVDGNPYKVGGYGQIGVIVGEQKSGKTFVLRHIVASALAQGRQMLTFSLKLRPFQNIVFFDTEQSEFFFKLTQKDMQDLAGVCNPAGYYAFHLRKFTKSERLTALKKIIEEIGNVGLIVIDGVVDLCPDYMDNKASDATVQELMTLSDQTKALVLTVLHVTKQNGFMRGHLGTELQNKCDFAMTVEQEKDSGVYRVKCRESRFAPYPPLTFTRDPETGRARVQGATGPDNFGQPDPFTTHPADVDTGAMGKAAQTWKDSEVYF
jgi:archaellum biogenesis ATPase FlaH